MNNRYGKIRNVFATKLLESQEVCQYTMGMETPGVAKVAMPQIQIVNVLIALLALFIDLV